MVRAECDLKKSVLLRISSKLGEMTEDLRKEGKVWTVTAETRAKTTWETEINDLVNLNVNLCSRISVYLIQKWVKQNILDSCLHGRSSDYLNIGMDHQVNYFIPENRTTSNTALVFLITWDFFPSLVTICIVVWKRQLL